MPYRPLLLAVTLLGTPALTGGAMLGAQQPSPYVPLGHWATPYLEHLIARGVIADPSPLSRPYVQADVVRALADRKSTRLNSSHLVISYAVFCLKKKKEHDVWARSV